MKLNWKELGKALWSAIKPVLLGAIGGGIVGISTGCTSMTPNCWLDGEGEREM